MPEKIDGGNALEAWLESLPDDVGEERARQIAVTLAFRSAARVFPLAVDGMPIETDPDAERDLTSLTVFRCLTIGAFAAFVPNGPIDRSPASASPASASAASASASYAAAASAAHASYAASFPSDVAAASAASAAAAATAAAAADAAVWDAVQKDIEALAAGRDLADGPLWPGDNPLAGVWERARAKLSAAPDDWSPVIGWYDHLLEPKGRALPPEMLREIVEIETDVWEKGPPKALRKIADIWGQYGPGAASVDRDLSRQARPAQSLIQEVKAQVGKNKEALPPTIAGLQQHLLQQIETLQQSNQLNADHPDLCRSLIASHVYLYEALDRIDALIPQEGAPADKDTEEIIGLGRLYWEKLSALPRDRADDVIQKVWDTGGCVVDIGLVFGSTQLLMQMGLPMNHSIALSTFAFGRKKARQIIKSAKDAWVPGGP
ncbi:MAG: hypothetical protein AAFQ50_11520 [Pseudomonadota bacterium]